MDESDRITARKNIMIFTNIRDLAPVKVIAPQNRSYDIIQSIRVGAVESGEPSPASTFKLQSVLLSALDSVLTYAATKNLGPTRSSRWYYLWFSAIAQGYNWVYKSGKMSGVKDDWDWDIHYPLETGDDISCWMTQILCIIMPTFNPAYDQTVLLEYERNTRGWTADEQQSNIKLINGRGNMSEWQRSWQAWITQRNIDGSVAAAAPPPASILPNGGTFLNVADTLQDPASFPQPTKWTPLQIGLNFQKYLTYDWQSVRSTCLTSDDEISINAAAAVTYPSDPTVRAAEINEVIQITNTLSDTQKVIAEFWAGGPNTVSPPGMCIWFWKTYVATKNIGAQNMDDLIFSGYDLALHVFETGRIVWSLKKIYMQARPIQEIRRLYRGAPMKKYDGSSITGEAWVPYQETNFVSPPFADFPSGHSAFSRSFANVMTSWFGPSIPTTEPITMNDLNLLSPHLEPQTQQFGTFVWNAGKSGIQNGVVPATQVILTWSSWAEMADSAGISRKYGGIHATSAHTGSVAAADMLHTILQSRMNVRIK